MNKKQEIPGINDLEEKLGLDKHFFQDLLEEDDWSFIIKLHTLIESAVTFLLIYHLKENGLNQIISRLELSNKTSGKIAYLKSLDLLGKDSRRFISTLSELRNKIVHDVRNCKFSLKNFISSLEDKDVIKFAKAFSRLGGRIVQNKMPLLKEPKGEELKKLINQVKKNPKFHIWLGALHLLILIYEMQDYSDYINTIKAEKF